MSRQNSNPLLAFFLVLLMATAGCIASNDSEEKSDEMVEIDLGEITKRSIGSPYLEVYSNCDELETNLKAMDSQVRNSNYLKAVIGQHK